MNKKTPVEAAGDHQKPKNLIRSQYKDIMVKVDEDVYYLDRLQLALKSEYFEKLFIEDYADKNCELIEIPVMDTDTFYAIVDIIYGASLISVFDSNNYVSLLMAMDYLQMEINPKILKSLFKKLLSSTSPVNMDVFRLYHFVAGNVNYEYLLTVIFQHLSRNLKTVKDLDEFLPISFDHFYEIIMVRDFKRELERTYCKICANWICYDLKNRLPHAITLVNAIKNRLKLPFDIDQENFSIPLPTIDEHPNPDSISSYFYKLLEYNGPICSANPGILVPECDDSDDNDMVVCDCDDEIVHVGGHVESNNYNNYGFGFTVSDSNNGKSDSKIQIISRYTGTSKLKLEKFLKGGIFCDIVVKTGEKMYKLHRSVLKSASGYFEEIFSAEYTEMLAKCEGIPSLSSINKEYSLNEIDQIIFDILIDYIYWGKILFSADIIVRLFKAAHLLKINDLLEQCESWMMDNSKGVCAQDVVEVLNFTHENVKYKNLNRVYLTKYIVDSWPEIGNLSQFADLFKAITVPEEIPSCSGESKVYLFNNVDQGTFQLIINYIYHGKLDLTNDNIVRILKASEIFKMKELMEECVKKLTERRQLVDLNSEDLIEVLRFAIRNTIYEDIIAIHSVKYVIQWPEIDDSLLCSFSYEALENILMSPDLYFDDPCKILDICSTWITHNMENRFHLVPRVALAISRNGLVNCNDHIIESPADLKNCSQDFVKSKLLEILSRTSIVPSAVSSNQEKKFKTEQPIFISSKDQSKTFSILNSDLDEITSLHIGKYIDRSSAGGPMSATMIKDNLFLMCSINEKSFFHVYNFSLKKLFSLSLDSRFNALEGLFNSPKKYTLLNCCSEIYCCIVDGTVLKYSFDLNRWKLFSESELDKHGLQFTSDGNILYRMYKMLHDREITNYIMEAYSVEHNSWISLPNVPVLSRPRFVTRWCDQDKTKYKLIFMNDFGFAVLFDDVLYLLTLDGERCQISLPDVYGGDGKRHSAITLDESGEMLYMWNNKLYRFSRSDQGWKFKKELLLKLKNGNFSHKLFPFENIVSIHKPIINT